jgi:pimeloyl-ACP methyl ester carboxylesterase
MNSVRTLFVVLFLSVAWADAAFAQQLPPLTRLKYNNPGLVVDLGVGLWAWPMPMDHDGDGDLDLLVACPDRPSNGVWYFENPGENSKERHPIFKPGVKLGPASKDMTLSMVNGTPRVLAGNSEITAIGTGDWKTRTPIYASETVIPIQHNRDNFWRFADYDGDGVHDLLVGHGDWTEFGWFTENDWWKDYNWQGVWTGGPLRSHILWLHNKGTDAAPEYETPEPLLANGLPISTFGRPGQNLADFDGDGDMDLLCGSFLDSFTYFQNTGTRTEPVYGEGRPLVNDGQVIAMDLEMIVPHAIDWDHDGDVDLIVGDEDGRVALVEHTGKVTDGLPLFERPYYFQQVADELKSGALASPSAVDWDGDGDDDLVTGNTAGYIEFFENLSGRGVDPPKWAAPVRLQTNANETIRIMAGPNGSIQGPCEAKWGYTTVSAVDWDHDGLPDILANSIWGKVHWYRNLGSRTQPELAAAAPIIVEWPVGAHPPKPAWNWWNPEAGELVTQWRTTPAVADLNADGLNDLVMLDHEGWLCFWPREERGEQLILKPGQRVLCDEKGEPLQLNPGSGGRSGRRKLHLADWDGDGKLDLLLNGTNAEFWRQIDFKDGIWNFQRVSDVSSTKIDAHDTSPTTVDFNADGHRDLVIGAEDGRFYFLHSSTSLAKAQPAFPGKRSEWNEFDRFDFEVDGRAVLVVAPKEAALGRPWVWHGEFFGHKPAPDIALLNRGFHIVYMSLTDMLGAPKAVAHWDKLYGELTTKYGFAKKAALVGLSRGGLYCFNWATANPDKVACIYADAAVCDFKSWPGGKGKGKGSPRDWKLVMKQYGFANEQEAMDYKGNPIDSLVPLAKAGVPLLHVYGDADDVVPSDENTSIVAERYKAIGGSITLIAKPGVGHHPHGLEDSTPIIEFIATHAAVQP